MTKSRENALEEKIAEAYQVIGALADAAGLFGNHDVQRALDYFSGAPIDGDILPWPRVPLASEPTATQSGTPFVGTAWLHIKSDHIYVVLGHCMIEATMQNGVLYRRIDGTGPQWLRPTDEFLDGRFGEVNGMSLAARPAITADQ